MLLSKTLYALAALASSVVLAAPANYPRFAVPLDHLEIMSMRARTEVNPKAIKQATCLDPNVHIVFHDENVAELSICDGALRSSAACPGTQDINKSQAGSALFTLQAVEPDAAIDVSKSEWEACVRAARAVCPTGSMRAVCRGGATKGDVAFGLDRP